MTPAKRRRLVFWASVLAIVAISILDHAGVFGYRAGDRRRYDGTEATVSRVIDGGTIDVDLSDGDGDTTRVRLLGVDVGPVGPSGTDSAAEFLRIRLVGRRVRVLLDPSRKPRDASGNLLAYVCEGENDGPVNEQLISRGLARADADAEHVFKLSFAQKEETARKRKSGLFADMAK